MKKTRPRPTLLGIDGGGTSTIAWLADSKGRVLGRGHAGPSNLKTVGPDAAREAIERSIAAAFSDGGFVDRPVESACLGLAGFDRPEDQALLHDWAEGPRWAKCLTGVNDGALVIAAGTPEGWGVGAIAGTGSIAVGRDREGRTARADLLGVQRLARFGRGKWRENVPKSNLLAGTAVLTGAARYGAGT